MNAAVADATDNNVLTFRSQEIPLRQLSIGFLKYYDCLTIGKAVARAMATHNLHNAEFTIVPEKMLQDCTIDDRHRNRKHLMTLIATADRYRSSPPKSEASQTEKVWVLPECLKLLSRALQNLQFLNLEKLPEGCDIAWTRFFLEAAPNLKEVCITVLDRCDMETDKVEREEQGYCDKTNVEWESSAPDGFRHHSLTKLTIYGFQPNENFMGCMRLVMEAVVNLDGVSLLDV